VGDDELRAGEVVIGDGVVSGCPAVPADDHGRHGARDPLEVLAGAGGCDEDQAVHAAIDHGVVDPGLGDLVVAGFAHQLHVIGALEAGGHAVEHVGEEGVADVRHRHADGVRLPAQSPGRGRRTVAELLDRRPHPYPHVGAGAVGVVQDLGDRGGGHARMASHVDDRHTPHSTSRLENVTQSRSPTALAVPATCS
jgi:hypothetical protein